VAEAWGQFGKAEEVDRPPLEAVTRGPVKTRLTEKIPINPATSLNPPLRSLIAHYKHAALMCQFIHPMRSLIFLIYLIIPAALLPCSSLIF
jgi:hypothetical protein